MLPQISSLEQYRAMNLRDPSFASTAVSILKELQLPIGEVTFPEDGSSPVAIVGEQRIIKFFAPLFADAFRVEKASLAFLRPLHSLAPTLLGDGMIDGWSYVVMSKLSGHSLKALWPSLKAQERYETCRQVGQALRKIHDLPVHRNAREAMDWPEFLNAQKAACVRRHEKLGLRPKLVSQIEPFLESVRLSSNGPQCFLHTEVMRDHVFFNRLDDRMEFSGFIDFEPSMFGEREYDFASIGIFLSSGDPSSLRAFFEGYGNLESLDEEFRRRILAYALLHKYSNLKWYLDFMPDAVTLDELAKKWWATSDH